MNDLAGAAMILLALSVFLYRIGLNVARRCSLRTSLFVSVAATTFTFCFALAVHGKPVLARLCPFSGVIVLGNWLPLGAGLLSGVLVGQRAVPRWRRITVALILLFLAWYPIACLLVRASLGTPGLSATAARRVQSTAVSCGPCCTVRVLAEYGIAATEEEMIDLCLTGRLGTPALGLYRGLKIKTRNTEWDVEILRGSVEELRQDSSGPALLWIRLCGFRIFSPARDASWGWTPGMHHTVVLDRFTSDGKAEIWDPAEATGESRRWTMAELDSQWRGAGFRLVRRSEVRTPNRPTFSGRR